MGLTGHQIVVAIFRELIYVIVYILDYNGTCNNGKMPTGGISLSLSYYLMTSEF